MIRRLRLSIVFLFWLFACKEADKNQPVAILSVKPYDKLRLTDLKNKPIDLKQYAGKTIFLNFWASWCKPCKEEMPSIERAQNILQNKNIVFLMASNESVEEINEFKARHNYKFNYIRMVNSEELDIQALPTTFIFDSRGTLVFSEMGFRQWDDKNNIDLILNINKTK